MKLLRKRYVIGLGASILSAACLGFGAWGMHKSSDRGTTVTFMNMTQFKNGATLPAGTYRMEVPENTQTPKVTFYKDGKPMATVDAKVVAEARKNSKTEIDSTAQGNTQQLQSIRPSGWNEKLVFGSNGAQGSSGGD